MKDVFKTMAVGGTQMKNVLDKGKELSKAVKRSGPMLQGLKRACKDLGMRYTTLKNPNDTRWNSQEKNLSSIIKLKPALQLLANGDATGDWLDKVFTPVEWLLAEAAVDVLKIPLYSTKAWEADKTPTMNLIVSELYSMKGRLQTLATSNDRWKNIKLFVLFVILSTGSRPSSPGPSRRASRSDSPSAGPTTISGVVITGHL
jgi:hypothetical protein